VDPVITGLSSATVVEDSMETISFTSSDDGHGSITWSLVTPMDFLSIDAETGALTIAPDNRHVGIYDVMVRVDDGNGGIVDHLLDLEVTNLDPIVSGVYEETVLEDTAYTVDFDSSDDGQGSLLWTLTTDADFLSIHPTTGQALPGGESLRKAATKRSTVASLKASKRRMRPFSTWACVASTTLAGTNRGTLFSLGVVPEPAGSGVFS